ncbi:inositol monophosphatase [Maribellus comscasis]|uniref:Inositol-1-monophosphatase n=1 Tax=Maribellus comscasis TaxID=2681766 RepID=A0A6I6JTE3_9BACT|nr:inositol monophosphatase family protein [Maribellus comscasis]QGY46316.1 inositol monophosphatase [Maribellus comscasis]
MDYKELCFQVQEIAKTAGTFIRNEREKVSSDDVELKSVASLVTYVDKNAEKQIVEALRQLIPAAGFVAEEGTADASNEKYKWFVDPLDGTTNYIHGVPPYSVSIGLSENNKMVLGVVFDVAHNELFYAWEGSPAYCNEKEIKVAVAKKSEDTLIATGFPYYDFEKTELYIQALKELMKNTRGIRRLGSAAVDLCYVAAGRFDAFYEHALHAWDVAAGVFILQQAGGKITDFNGGDNWLFGGEIIAASNNYFSEFFKIINKFLGKK